MQFKPFEGVWLRSARVNVEEEFMV
jgi:hypothetical protein